MIVDEISMVKLDKLSNIVKQLAKSRGLSSSSMAVFENLSIIIVMRNFYQFPPIASRFFWNKSQTNKDHNSKTL